MRFTTVFNLLSALAPSMAVSSPRVRAATDTATVDLTVSTGNAQFLGSGFIYGFPDNGTSADSSIPDSFLTDIKFNANRAGGAQISDPGWAYGGYETYLGRFNSTLSNYRTARKYGATFILLPHDIWGAQGGADSTTPFPGDNGNWTEMETFYSQLITDIKANDMLEGLVMDLWNEPDLSGFWARDWSQYVEYFVRATKIVRDKLPGTLISGPSMAHSPSTSDKNWKAWMSSVSGNDTVPDVYSWHQIGSWEREPDVTIPDFNSLRTVYNLPERPFHVNEYAWPSEQNPANSVYYLAQCERHDILCLRANWGGGSELHDYMANLVWKQDGVYYPNGEWQLYKYYANMVGERVNTTASSDLQFDVFATVSDNTLKIIAGTRTIQSAYQISVSGLSKLKLSSEGDVSVHSYQFNWAGSQGEIDAPVDLGSSQYTYSDDTLLITVNPPDNSTAFAYEISG